MTQQKTDTARQTKASRRNAAHQGVPTGAATGAVNPLADELRPGQSIELLKELHILTREGKLNQDSRRKLKQVYHLYQFIEKLLLELPGVLSGQPNDSHTTAVRKSDGVQQAGIALADHGAGKSYLGFILYDLFFKHRAQGHIYGIESRPELVQKSQELAARLGFDRMSFLNLTVAQSAMSELLPQRIDVVTALHACDTATDDAIAFGLQKRARVMVLVPCCQAEVARVLSQHKALSLSRTPLSELWRHPLHTREMGSQITNVLRCLYLEACGYQVTVTELVGWEHSMKNELIIARYTDHPKHASAQRLRALLAEFDLLSLLHTRFTSLPDNDSAVGEA
ncbi:SAM-dependent methyltransferase [Rhodoferax sp.]|uniref:class I SAM-dependent methyltransferase n=1 Tax=Rhodoferax sp. TaxID=50421 RepID=UPI00283EB377|nr:SAM-dependent methyltransferase [Rhodoferax sp.]MDR3370015.1 SAM-dependent methyltransferase [Rhodoferax sp.]